MSIVIGWNTHLTFFTWWYNIVKNYYCHNLCPLSEPCWHFWMMVTTTTMMMTTMMAMVLLLLLLLYDDDDDDVNGGRAVDDEPCGCAAGTFSSQLRTRCFLIIFPRFASTADHCGYYRDEDIVMFIYLKLRNSVSSFHWLSSSIFNVRRRRSFVPHPWHLLSSIWCFRPYKSNIFCEDMILATCQCHSLLSLAQFTVVY